MRVNIYAEEMTDRVELVTKQTADGTFTGIRFYLYLPVTLPGGYKTDGCMGEQDATGTHVRGPFMHHPGDDDSAAVTFWGKQELRKALVKALQLLDGYEPGNGPRPAEGQAPATALR